MPASSMIRRLMTRALRGPKDTPIRRDCGWVGRPIETLEDRTVPALVINPTFDTTITSDPNAALIMAGINRTIAAYQNSFSSNVTVNIKFQLGGGLGSSSTFFVTTTYASYRAALAARASTADDASALATLPTGTNQPIAGTASNTNLDISAPTARALGLGGLFPLDSTITLNTSIMNLDRTGAQNASKYDLMAVTAHEMDEALGFGSGLDGLANGAPISSTNIEAADLFRYASAGVRSFNTTAASAAYFSIDGGTTLLARFNQTAGADFGDWYSPGGQTPQVQDAFGTPGSLPNLDVELRRLDVVGFTRVAPVSLNVTPPTTQTSAPGVSTAFNLGTLTNGNGPFKVTVNWNDGSPNTTFYVNNTGSLGTKFHTYALAGNYTPTVTITDFTSQTGTQSFPVAVGIVNTSTVLTSPVSTSVYGQAVDFTATVTASSGVLPPAGSVEIFDLTTGTDLGAATLTSTTGTTLVWSFTTTPTQLKVTTAPAAHVIRAVFTGTGGFQNSSGLLAGGETITPLTVSVSGITANNKVYDATFAAPLNLGGATLSGVLAGDIVALNTAGAVGTFATKDVAAGITVAVTGLTLTGPQAGNYVVGPTSTGARITPFALSVSGVTASGKVYDATRAATVNTGGANLVGVFAGDAVALNTAGAVGTFATKNVGPNSVAVTGLTLTGAQAGNYTVIATTPAATITPFGLTVSGVTANKVFDGTTAAPLDTSGAALVGALAGDAVTLSVSGATGTFATPNVGLNPVAVTGLTLTGADAGNYTLTQPAVTGRIRPPVPTRVAVGSTTGGVVSLFDKGVPLALFVRPFANFRGGIAAAVGDLNGDGVGDLVVVKSSGGPAEVKAFDGSSGNQLLDFYVFPTGYKGGASLALADLDGNGRAQIVVGRLTGSSTVAVFDGMSGALRTSFVAYPEARVGVNVAAGIVDDSGRDRIVTGPTGIAPLVRVFDGNGGSVRQFFAFDPAIAAVGVTVGVGDLNSNGEGKILVGVRAGGADYALLFGGDGSGRIVRALPPALARIKGNAGGPKLTVADTNGDGLAELLVSVGSVAGTFVGPNLAPLTASVLDPQYLNGSFLA